MHASRVPWSLHACARSTPGDLAPILHLFVLPLIEKNEPMLTKNKKTPRSGLKKDDYEDCKKCNDFDIIFNDFDIILRGSARSTIVRFRQRRLHRPAACARRCPARWFCPLGAHSALCVCVCLRPFLVGLSVGEIVGLMVGLAVGDIIGPTNFILFIYFIGITLQSCWDCRCHFAVKTAAMVRHQADTQECKRQKAGYQKCPLCSTSVATALMPACTCWFCAQN